jgi:uncharacterized membrane protein (UPF0127 family)
MISTRRCAIVLLLMLMTACGGAADPDDTAAPSPEGEAVAPSEHEAAVSPSPSPEGEAAAPSPEPLQPSEGFDSTVITLSSGDEQIAVPVWVADDDLLRQRGLMDRTSLRSDAGMLFVFEAPTDSGFWMKNTLIPLSIAYIDDDGQILETLDMEPCEADPCRVYTPGVIYRYALEVNRGFFDDHGVSPGWTIDLGDAGVDAT